MDNAGCFILAAVDITTPLAAVALDPIVADLDGMEALTLEFAFGFGSGGTAVDAVVRTRLGDGASWRDIARAHFTTASATKYCTLKRDPKAMTAYAALAAEGVNDSLLGNALQVVLTTTGTYADTTLAVRASAS